MSGKFPKCLLLILFSLTVLWITGYSDDTTGKKVNGYDLDSLDSEYLKGLRRKALGDMLLNQESYATAIKYYEEATLYIPDEADIYFNLGNCYYNIGAESTNSGNKQPGIYAIAAEYYTIALDKYDLEENQSKSKKNYYLSMIRLGTAYNLIEKNSSAKELGYALFDEDDDIYSDFPGITNELRYFYQRTYGDQWKYLTNM